MPGYGEFPAAQRRPEITPGYDRPAADGQSRLARTALNEGRRLPPATTSGREGPEHLRRRRSTKAGDYPRLRRGAVQDIDALNEGRRLPPATTPRPSASAADIGLDRSTKAGDYPRLRHDAHRRHRAHARCRSTKAGDYPRLRLSWCGAQCDEPGPRSTKAGDYPRLRPSVHFRRLSRKRSPLNEGRRLPPATTRPERDFAEEPVVRRSTKAGDYPRLRPVSSSAASGESPRRSTKAGDYPRLRPAAIAPPPALRLGRSTKAGDYPRLRLLSSATRPYAATGAQRRPEITPGYDGLM